MSSRNKIKTMLICLLESEIENDYRERGFYGRQISEILERERSTNRFQKEADELLKDLEKDFFKGSINEIASELKNDNNQIKELLIEKRKLLNEVRVKFNEDFGDFSSTYKSNVQNKILSKIEYLELNLNTLARQKLEIQSIAKRKASSVSWIYFLFSLAALIIWIALIYFVYDWNFVEPITWISGVVIIVSSNAVYAIFGSKITPENLKSKRYNIICEHLFGLYRYDQKESDLISKEIEIKKKYLQENAAANNI